MPNPFKSKNYKNLKPIFFLAVAIIIAFKVILQINYVLEAIGWLWSVLLPFLYGFVIAYILNIPYSGLQKLIGKIRLKFISKVKKPVALVITLALTVLVIYLFFYLVMPYIINSISFFVINLPLYYRDLQNFIDNINELDFFGLYISLDGIYSSIRDFLQNIRIEDVFTSLNAIWAVPGVLISAILSIISAIYILIEKERFKRFIARFIKAFTPAAVSGAIFIFTGKLNKNFKKYLYVQTLYGLIFGVVSTITLVIMGSPYFVILGVLLGISNYIPVIGSIVATIFAVIVVAFTQDMTMAIIATIVIFIIQQIGANVLHPKMMGQSFKFSPLLVLVSIVVGGAVAGVFGMIVAIPIAVALKDLIVSIMEYVESRRGKIDSNLNKVSDFVEVEENSVEKISDSEDSK